MEGQHSDDSQEYTSLSSDDDREMEEAGLTNESENRTTSESSPLKSLPCAQNILNDNPRSTLTHHDLDRLRCEHQIPDNIEMRLPQGKERADWMIPGWSTVYYHPFDYGFKLPVSGFLKSFCEFIQMNPSQLTPNTLRKIFGIEELCKMVNLRWDPVDFFYNYCIRLHNNSYPGRFLLRTVSSPDGLIWNLPTTEKVWKDKYFFVRVDWIGGGSDQIPNSWILEPQHMRKGRFHGPHSEERVGRLMKIDHNLKDWEQLLLSIKHKAQKGNKKEDKGKSYSNEMITRRARLRLKANANVNTNTAKCKEAASQNSNGSNHVVTSPLEAESGPPPNKRPRIEPPSGEGETKGEVTSICIPVGGSLEKNPTSILIEARKLLLPKDKRIMQEMNYKDLAEEEQKLALKLFQHQVYREGKFEKQQKYLYNCMRTIKELSSSNADLVSRLEASEKAAAESEKKIKELKEAAADSNEKIKELKTAAAKDNNKKMVELEKAADKKIKELETEVDQHQEKELQLITQIEHMKLQLANKEKQVTGALMREFLRGKITSEFAHRAVSEWETYLSFWSESIPNEIDEEEVKPKV